MRSWYFCGGIPREILKIVQDYGSICFPRMSHEGFLGTMLARYHQSDSKWGRPRFDAHPALAIGIANVLANTVLYAATFSMIESLTLGPREGQVPSVRIKSFLNIDLMQFWRISESNPRGPDNDQIDKETVLQRLVHEDAFAKEGCRVPHSENGRRGRTYEQDLIHLLSKTQFAGTAIVPGANVLMPTTELNEGKRDRQMQIVYLMRQGTQNAIIALTGSAAFGNRVVTGSPISLPDGTSIPTLPEGFQFPPPPLEGDKLTS